MGPEPCLGESSYPRCRPHFTAPLLQWSEAGGRGGSSMLHLFSIINSPSPALNEANQSRTPESKRVKKEKRERGNGERSSSSATPVEAAQRHLKLHLAARAHLSASRIGTSDILLLPLNSKDRNDILCFDRCEGKQPSLLLRTFLVSFISVLL